METEKETVRVNEPLNITNALKLYSFQTYSKAVVDHLHTMIVRITSKCYTYFRVGLEVVTYQVVEESVRGLSW